MTGTLFGNGAGLLVEIRQWSLEVLYGSEKLSFPLQRTANGRLTDDCHQQTTEALRGFLKRKAWQPKLRALCAIDSRGVSLRVLSLPTVKREELPRLLKLQIESEFPVSPEALAWGYRPINNPSPTNKGQTELLVAAVKKEILEDYARIFSSCGVTLSFTLAALTRNVALPAQPADSYALLDIGRKQSELTIFEKGVPAGIRILSWGGENITRALEQRLGITGDDAEKLKCNWDDGSASNGEVGHQVQEAMGEALDGLARLIHTNWKGDKLYLSGRSTRYKAMPRRLLDRLSTLTKCERLELSAGENGTAAIVGLRKSFENHRDHPALWLKHKEIKAGSGKSTQSSWASSSDTFTKVRESWAETAVRKWIILSAVLGLACLCFPYAQAIIVKPFLAKRIESVTSQKGRLKTIDREYGFLSYLKKNQPPYLDALTIIANSVAQGTRFDSVSMNRRGEVSLRGTMQNLQQVVDFRSKLIKSGFFANVTVEEQTPTQDRQKLTVRMSAQWKPANAREQVKIDTTPKEPHGGGGPSPFPPGMDSPEGMGGFPPPMPMPMPMPEGSNKKPAKGPPAPVPTTEKATNKTDLKSSSRVVRVNNGDGSRVEFVVPETPAPVEDGKEP